MAETIRGIKIQLNIDVDKFKDQVKQTTKELKKNQVELNQINKLLKFDPKNTELLRQKQTLLNTQYDKTKEKIEALKSVQKELSKEPEKHASELRKVTREIIQQEQSVNKFEKQLKEVNYQLSNWSKAEKTFKNTGSALEGAGQKLKGLSVASAGVVAGAGALAVKTASFADEILTLSSVTGQSTDELQRYKKISELTDVSLETLSKSQMKLTKNMYSAQKGSKEMQNVFSKLGVEFKNADGLLRNMDDVFNDAIDALGKMENETERNAYAMQLFGKSGQELNPIISMGSEELKKMKASATNILDKKELENLGKLDDTVQKTKATFDGFLNKIGSKIATLIEPHLKTIEKFLDDVAKWIETIDPNVLAVILGFAGILAVVAPILILFGKLAFAIGSISSLFGGASAAVGTAGASIGALALPILAIIGLIALFVAGFVDLYNSSEEFRLQVDDVINGVMQTFQGLVDFLTGIFTGDVDLALSGLKDMFEGFVLAMPELLKIPIEVVQHLFGGMFEFIDKIFGTNLKGTFDMFMATFKNVIDNVFGVFDALINFISNVFTENWEGAWRNIISIFRNLWNLVGNIFKTPINAIVSVFNAFTSLINRALSSINIKIPDWVPFVGGKGFSIGFRIPQIPYLKIGTDEVYRDGLAMLHKGERVVPAHVAKGGYTEANNTYTIYTTVELDKEIVGRSVSEIVDKVQGRSIRRNGSY